ncbi:MAG: dTDP-glucose 4,6-dehydratase [Patescibacteria group bacterium]
MPKRNLKNARFLVTGGAGFIGSNFIRYLLSKTLESKITVVDNLSYAGNKHNLDGLPKSRVSLIGADINETRLMTKLFQRVDYVVHFAAETHVDRSIHKSSKSFIVSNVLGTHSLLQAIHKSPNIKLFIHVSTDEVFGSLPLKSKRRFREDSPYFPNSPYAASKAAADMLVRSFIQTWYLPIIIIHPANNYGPRQLPEKLIPFFTTRALQNLPLPVYGHGKHVRSWLHVDDCSSAIVTLLQKGVAGENYCVTSDEELSNLETTERILETLKKPLSLITHVTDRPGHDERYTLDASKLKKLGWRATRKLRVYLPKTVLWYRNNRDWVQSSMRRTGGVNGHIYRKILGISGKEN